MAQTGGQGASFELERFTWQTPDRLELAGSFSGLGDLPPEAPVLVVDGEHETHRLASVDDNGAWPPAEGESWSAAFAWSEPPAPFATARLELGDGRHFELPEPGARRPRFGRRVLEVHGAHDDAGAASAVVEEEEQAPAPLEAVPAPAPAEAATPGERVAAHADLVLAREEALAAADRARDAEERLETERARRAADADRFREALAAVGATADQTLEAERAANAELGDDLRAAHDELERLRARAAELEAESEQARETAARAKRLEAEHDELSARFAHEQRAAERLRERLASVKQALADEG
ncbi:MAG TPA: hypothetical protein VN751_01325 [Solirubrobacteraceae bacterium]|nr:hypothetical protein [Solirubrobacteraceae bacterium]